ncbi:MAG: hypothetical protein KIS73_29465 [Enhydrobacter sp.]|uniref:Rad52/Rad22 family DNA repair protein n=1 Tax=Parvibaculum sp. TaxID=2024848 RepID=UPI001D6B4C98|nr:Rad52/Rad22 family DNA repair protein [Parvibaculum sp.]MBX3489187.1 hypothetical protein [Parvibaculum sp.]MCW5738288.1 hypothetical protein [Enhydrobacter sp.]
MPLTRKQVKALGIAPPADAIRTREEGGKSLSYLEGWYLVREANRIFGPERWDRITLTTQCVWQGKYEGKPACSYTARVRLCIRAGTASFVREGSGVGHGQGLHPGEAHGQALKAAETDATKRALATIGAPFGLTLYETAPADGKARDAADGVPADALSPPANRTLPARDRWLLRDPAGEVLGFYTSPIMACSALRRAVNGAADAITLEALYTQNKRFLARLVAERPDLVSDTGRHYAAILSALFQARLKALSMNGTGGAGTARAARDTEPARDAKTAEPAQLANESAGPIRIGDTPPAPV